ncbi:TPA: hypothetical protein ACF2DD_002062 [Clostridium perfringens]
MKESGYKVTKDSLKSFKDILESLSNIKNKSNKLPLLIFLTDKNYKPKELVKIKFNALCEKDKEEKSNDKFKNFFVLQDYEKEKIFKYKEKGIDNNILFSIFCCLKSRMQFREINLSKGFICYPSYVRISKDVGCSTAIIYKYINILQDLNLIVIHNIGTFKNIYTNCVTESNNTYILYDRSRTLINNFIEEINTLFLSQKKAKGFKLLKDIDRTNFKKIGGEKGRIKRLIKEGKAIEKDITRLEEIENILNENRQKCIQSKEIKENNKDLEEYENNLNEAINDLDTIEFWG